MTNGLAPHWWDGEQWTCLICGTKCPDPCGCPCHDADPDPDDIDPYDEDRALDRYQRYYMGAYMGVDA